MEFSTLDWHEKLGSLQSEVGTGIVADNWKRSAEEHQYIDTTLSKWIMLPWLSMPSTTILYRLARSEL